MTERVWIEVVMKAKKANLHLLDDRGDVEIMDLAFSLTTWSHVLPQTILCGVFELLPAFVQLRSRIFSHVIERERFKNSRLHFYAQYRYRTAARRVRAYQNQ